MARIFRTSDRIPVKIGAELTITISPLSFAQKTELQSVMMQAVQDPMRAVKGASLAIKYSVKGVSGVETLDGTSWQPKFEGDVLADESVDDLMNLEESGKIVTLCTQLIAGVPVNGVIDPQTKKKMEGITFELPKKPKARK